MKRNANVRLFVLKFRLKSKFLLFFFRFSQRSSLSLWKKKSKSLLSLLSLFSLSWKWKFLLKDKIFQRLNNFVKISLTCVKIRRFRLFNSSMISTISSVEKYNFANTVTIIVNRLSVSMSVSTFVFFRFSVKKKKRNFVFDFVKSSISRSYDAVFLSIFSIFFDALSVFSILLNVVFFSTFSTLFDVESVSFARFFVSFSSSYRDWFFVFSFRFLSKIFQKDFHVSFHSSMNFKKKCEIFFELLRDSDSTAKAVEIFSTLTWIKRKFCFCSFRDIASRLKIFVCRLCKTRIDMQKKSSKNLRTMYNRQIFVQIDMCSNLRRSFFC